MNLLVKFLQCGLLFRVEIWGLLKERFEVRFEAERNFLELRIWIQLRIGGHVIEKDQGILSELFDDSILGQVALYETAIGAHDGRRKKQLRLCQQGLQHVAFERQIRFEQFLDDRFQ